LRAIAVTLAIALASCGTSSTGDAFGPDPQGSGDGATAGDAGASDASSTQPGAGADADAGPPVVFHVGDAASDGAEDDGDCPASAKLVYVTGEGGQLWSFYPPTMKFTLIGTMSCLPAVPSHMTVDRTGTAWVESNGLLYRASTTDASCTAVSSWTANTAYSSFALSFLGTTAATDTTLYMLSSTVGSGLGGGVLGAFDTTTGAVTTVGDVNISDPAGDMTTNGDGTLYFLLDTEPLTLYEIRPSTGAIANMYTVGAPGGGDQALAFWGGSFYAFESGDIYTFDTGTKATVDLGAAPLSVTGAGQSTCVPMVAPPAQ
jgi:hypothetical protein